MINFNAIFCLPNSLNSAPIQPRTTVLKFLGIEGVPSGHCGAHAGTDVAFEVECFDDDSEIPKHNEFALKMTHYPQGELLVSGAGIPI